MRQLFIQVPHGHGQTVLEIAGRHKGTNLSVSGAADPRGRPLEAVVAHLPNAQLGPFLADLEPIPDLHLTTSPHGVILLKPPPDETPQQVMDVTLRSPFEVFVSGLQSIGSWRGFLGYAAVAGVVVWLGLFTNTVYLLVAAMLIAPFAGPAMNLAIATARGDTTLLWRSVVRYVAALAVSIAVAALLSLAFQQQIATLQMASTANISAAAALLPLAAGAAGALNLAQSERSSLVSGAATGMLVAASLAPPAGLIGMAAVIGRWDMAKSGLFLLALQLVGINLAGAALFRLVGLEPGGPRYARGKAWAGWMAGALTIVGLAALLLWQFGSDRPTFQRETLEERARAVIGEAVEDEPAARLVEANVRFTRADIPGQDTLLAEVYVERSGPAAPPDDDIQRALTEKIQQAIQQRGYGITPLVDVTVLTAPQDAAALHR